VVSKTHKPFIINGDETVFARNKAWAAITAVKQDIVSGEDPVTVLDPDTSEQSTFIMGIQSGYWKARRQEKTDGAEHEVGC
jgi:hypothetical protein